MSVVPWFGELTEEQKFSVRMESIFMPNARAKRDSFFFAAPNRLAHYTSAESALKIIQSKRLWMRSTTCMADFREVEHGYQLLQDYFADSSKKSQFFSALDECVPSAISGAISLFDQWWANIRFNTYIASIAEHEASEDLHGRLSMWRAFGKDVSKVALVLRLGPNEAAAQNALNVMFNPVLYLDREAVHAMLDQVAMKVKSESEFLGQLDRNVVIQWLFVMLISCVTCLKHEGFQEEREWRAIYSPKRAASPLMTSAIEVISGIPQPIYRIPLDKTVAPELESLDFANVFDRLIIGPSQFPFVMAEAFENALREAGVKDAAARICKSGIPLRT